MSYIKHSTWTDIYGGAWLLLEGDYGGGDYVLACTLRDATALTAQLEGLPTFKGNLYVAIWERNWRCALRHAVQEILPKEVWLLEGENTGETGSRETLVGEFTAPSGLKFLENGEGWQGLGHVVTLATWLEHLPKAGLALV
jgi:hypothetical protein